jgi:hypothetical protein
MPTLTIFTEDNEVTYSSYTGSGPLAFTFPYFQKEDLNVDVDGVTISRSLWDDTPNPVDGGNDGGSIILTNAVAGKDVRIWRDTVRLRSSQFGTGGATSRQMSNTTLVSLTESAAGPASVTYFGLWSAQTGGNFLVYGLVNPPANFLAGDIVRFPAGGLVIRGL